MKRSITSHQGHQGFCGQRQVAELMLRVSEYNQMLGEDAEKLKNHGYMDPLDVILMGEFKGV